MMGAFKIIGGLLGSGDLPGIPRTNTAGNTQVENVLKLVFGIAGSVAILIIVIAGMQYVLSQGNPQATAKAKNAILYAVIGLVICISAFAIVSFVVKSL